MTCGITVAPRMPVASSRLSGPAKPGTRPAASGPISIGTRSTVITNPMTITANSPATARSNGRCPRSCSASSPKATTPVTSPPIGSGSPKSRYSATAPPITSARSVAIATHSACTHSPMLTRRGKVSRQTSGRLRPVASPSLADRDWISIAMTLAATITHSSR